ncbi:TetR/AcrR family transcriptional regulator [Micromonospora sp. NPDC049559]|uniref:TetR/AcrR family transcriptional regulator n=1 Tax=Micromonospora sp. NPDC049559 TaxID=3155923 RepID=UPI00343D2FD9
METTPTEGLRARKKRLTREAIATTAARLFAERGYDAVTVGAVARAADVSEQTVYNYFPTKEHLVFDKADTFEAALREMIINRPAGGRLLGGLRPGVARFIDDAIRSPSPGGMPRLVAVSPALRRSWLDLIDKHADSLARTLVDESAGALSVPTARILAGAILAVFDVVVRELGRPDPIEPHVVDELRRHVTVALDHLEHGLARL